MYSVLTYSDRYFAFQYFNYSLLPLHTSSCIDSIFIFIDFMLLYRLYVYSCIYFFIIAEYIVDRDDLHIFFAACNVVNAKSYASGCLLSLCNAGWKVRDDKTKYTCYMLVRLPSPSSMIFPASYFCLNGEVRQGPSSSS